MTENARRTRQATARTTTHNPGYPKRPLARQDRCEVAIFMPNKFGISRLGQMN